MTTESCRLAPTLIDAMHRITTIDRLCLIVNLQVSLTLIAVMIQEDVYRSILLWGDTEDGCMTAACHLHLQMLLRQTDGIVMRMGDLFCMREGRGPFFWSQTQLSTKGSEGKRAIVLRATSHNPVAIAETLQQRVRIIIRCNALLLCISCLRCPEILPIRGQHGW